MRCEHCGAEWSISIHSHSVQKFCPACGKPITQPRENSLTSLEETLIVIVRDYGIQQLQDGARAMAYFSDLAPHLSKERVMLQHLIQCNGNALLISALQKSPSEQQACLRQIITRMVEDLFLSETAANMICSSFWNAITASEKPPVKPAKPETPVTPVKPMTPAKERTPAELYKAACACENKDAGKALRLMTAAAEAGDVQAQLKLAKWYREGTLVKGVPQEAFRWYKMAAESGDTNAMCNLGWCYITAFGCTFDGKAAVDCFTKAAKAGIPEAYYNLARCYSQGKGVEKNDFRAAALHESAAKAGYVESQYCLGWCYEHGQGLPKDLDLAVFWYRKAAQNHSARAQFAMGMCYELGRGFDKDENIAYYWYKQAADNGYEEARQKLKELS